MPKTSPTRSRRRGTGGRRPALGRPPSAGHLLGGGWLRELLGGGPGGPPLPGRAATAPSRSPTAAGNHHQPAEDHPADVAGAHPRRAAAVIRRWGASPASTPKPRSKPTEVRGGVDCQLLRGPGQPAGSSPPRRGRADPQLMLACYHHAAMNAPTRALAERRVASRTWHHPEYWDLSFFRQAAVPAELREEYSRPPQAQQACASWRPWASAPWRTSPRGLLHQPRALESCTTSRPDAPGAVAPGWYDLTTHLPWIGRAHRDPGTGRVEFFPEHPATRWGVKLGPACSPRMPSG